MGCIKTLQGEGDREERCERKTVELGIKRKRIPLGAAEGKGMTRGYKSGKIRERRRE